MSTRPLYPAIIAPPMPARKAENAKLISFVRTSGTPEVAAAFCDHRTAVRFNPSVDRRINRISSAKMTKTPSAANTNDLLSSMFQPNRCRCGIVSPNKPDGSNETDRIGKTRLSMKSPNEKVASAR